jgi:hypothetical protein
MKTFSSLREKMGKGMPKGQHVFDSKVGGHDLMIHKEMGKFVAYIDSEKLDVFKSINDAKKAMTQFVKMAGGKKKR